MTRSVAVRRMLRAERSALPGSIAERRLGQSVVMEQLTAVYEEAVNRISRCPTPQR